MRGAAEPVARGSPPTGTDLARRGWQTALIAARMGEFPQGRSAPGFQRRLAMQSERQHYENPAFEILTTAAGKSPDLFLPMNSMSRRGMIPCSLKRVLCGSKTSSPFHSCG